MSDTRAIAGVRRSLLPFAGLLALMVASPGCLGPEAIRTTRLRYNEIYRKTSDEQLLLNIVRMRYAESPVLIDLPTITGQFEAGAVGGFNTPGDGLDPGFPSFGIGQLTLRDTPTLSYHPRGGQEIAKTLVDPLKAEVLRVISPGTDTFLFLLMAVNDINDIPNAPLATSLVPRVPQDNANYREVVELFVGLQERGAAELAIATFDGEAHDPLPTDRVTGRDMIEAAKEGYTFQNLGGQSSLRKREKSVVLKIRPNELRSPDVVHLTEVLGLDPGQRLYKVRSEQSEEESMEQPLPNPLGEDSILVNMRSVLDIMVFLSKGVCIPPDHFASGVAPITPGVDRPVHDWKDITRGLFSVRSQKHRPRDAEVAVPYRGHWFYIDRADIASRSTLTLLELLLELQETERSQQAPLLTLPLN
ncbi:hypothetical protein P12x_000237 [Tundrisphaera lichenicola]|uniref:hypothetical protein n=1 Tax=Tundrisphaera lichenicola TaxID=2029860 RepID=UPI003EBC3B04